ncbi:MAG: sensor histidine kinase [Myxococcaceae bacterium]
MSDGNIVQPEAGGEQAHEPERRLLENERRRLEAILQQMPEGVLAIEASSGRVLVCNSQLEAMVGRKLDSGRRYEQPEAFTVFEGYRLDGSAYEPNEWPLARSLFENERVDGEEIELVRPDGSVLPVHMSSSPVHDAQGRLVAAVGLVTDVSRGRRAQAELRAGERRQKLLIAELAQARRRSDARASVAALLNSGRALEEVLQQALISAAQALGSDDGALWLREADGRLRGVAELRALGRVGLSREVELSPNRKKVVNSCQPLFLRRSEAREGDTGWLDHPGISGSLLCPLLLGPRCIGLLHLNFREPDFQPTPEEVEFAQNVAAQCAVAIDRTRAFEERSRLLAAEQAARHDAEAAAAEARRQAETRERLMAVVGHDLRNPLNVITTTAYLLSKRPGLSEEHARGIERIERSARRMARMISDLLDFSRARAGGGLPIDRQPVDLGALARRAVDEAQAAYGVRQVRFGCEGDCTGRWDPDRLAQVLANLLGNAYEYGDPAGVIDVRVSGEPAQVVLRVHNGGVAIAPDELATLFEPFQRLRREGRQGATSGLGLGLYIVREIARGYGGTAEADSSPAEGTTFTVRLPRDGAQG